MPRGVLEKGFAMASVDYRLSGDAIFPASIQDCKSAVRWLRSHAAEHKLDPNAFVAFGESAGAHQASMLGLTPEVTDLDPVDDGLGKTSSAVQGVVAYYGPTDFLQMDSHAPKDGKSMLHDPSDSPESLYIGGTIQEIPEKVQRANPVRYASSKAPPFFIAHGVEDHVVPFHQSVLLDKALREAGAATVVFHPVEGADHVWKGITENQSKELDMATDKFLQNVIGGN